MKPRKNPRVLARFHSTSTEDLDPELISLAGTEAVFYYHRFVEDDDTPYSEQWVLTTEDQRFGDYSFPECNFEILQEKQTA